jgi:outer membrane protein TolC
MSIGRTLCVLAALGLGAATPVWAEGPPSIRAMTLPEALTWARAHQPTLAAARARLSASRAEAFIPRAAWYPRAAANAQLLAGSTNNTTTSYAAAPGIDLVRIGGTRTAPTGDWSPSPSSLAALGVRQEVFDFGRLAAAAAAGDALAEAQGDRAEVAALNVDLAVDEGFLAVQAARAVLQAADAALARARAHRDEARAGVQSGLRRPIELTRAEADVARFEVGQVRAQGGVTSAQSVFAAAVGVPEYLLDAQGDVPQPAAPPELEQALALALARDPGLRAANALVEAQHDQARAIAAELRPDLQLTATLSSRAGGGPPSAGTVPSGGGWVPVVPNWDVGLVLSWPFFDRVVFARHEAAVQQETARRAEADELRAQLVAAVQGASVALRTAAEAIPALERSLASARANSAQAEARFKAGLGSQLELADAEALRVDAEIQLALGQFEHARARARLGRVLSEEPG